MHRRRFFSALLAAMVAGRDRANVTVSVREIRIESDDPDRFAFGLAEVFERAKQRRIVSALGEG